VPRPFGRRAAALSDVPETVGTQEALCQKTRREAHTAAKHLDRARSQPDAFWRCKPPEAGSPPGSPGQGPPLSFDPLSPSVLEAISQGSPTTRFSPTARTPAWSRLAGRSNGYACHGRTTRAPSGRSSTVPQARSGWRRQRPRYRRTAAMYLAPWCWRRRGRPAPVGSPYVTS
jgi:hypothetical protein